MQCASATKTNLPINDIVFCAVSCGNKPPKAIARPTSMRKNGLAWVMTLNAQKYE